MTCVIGRFRGYSSTIIGFRRSEMSFCLYLCNCFYMHERIFCRGLTSQCSDCVISCWGACFSSPEGKRHSVVDNGTTLQLRSLANVLQNAARFFFILFYFILFYVRWYLNDFFIHFRFTWDQLKSVSSLFLTYNAWKTFVGATLKYLFWHLLLLLFSRFNLVTSGVMGSKKWEWGRNEDEVVRFDWGKTPFLWPWRGWSGGKR